MYVHCTCTLCICLITMLVTVGSAGGTSGGLSSPRALDDIAAANTSIPVSVSTVCILYTFVHVYICYTCICEPLYCRICVLEMTSMHKHACKFPKILRIS